MGVVTFHDSFTSSVPAPRLFKAMVLDPANTIPKAAPQYIKNFEIIEGTGGPGSIAKVTFGEGAPSTHAKQKLDVLDKDNLIVADTVIEGGELSDKIQSITRESKFESTPDAGCVVKSTIKYHLKAGAELTEEEVKPAKEAAHAVFKGVEAYLLANPNA